MKLDSFACAIVSTCESMYENGVLDCGRLLL